MYLDSCYFWGIAVKNHGTSGKNAVGSLHMPLKRQDGSDLVLTNVTDIVNLIPHNITLENFQDTTDRLVWIKKMG